MRDERAERDIELPQNVFDLSAVRSKCVTDIVEDREAHAEEVGAFALSELEAVYQRCGELAEIDVGQRGRLPQREELRVDAAAAVDWMRKEAVPSGQRTLADAGVAIHVRLGRTRKRPDTAEILLIRILLDEFLDRRHWPRGKRFRGGPRSGGIIEPHHRVGGATGQ